MGISICVTYCLVVYKLRIRPTSTSTSGVESENQPWHRKSHKLCSTQITMKSMIDLTQIDSLIVYSKTLLALSLYKYSVHTLKTGLLLCKSLVFIHVNFQSNGQLY